MLLGEHEHASRCTLPVEYVYTYSGAWALFQWSVYNLFQWSRCALFLLLKNLGIHHLFPDARNEATQAERVLCWE